MIGDTIFSGADGGDVQAYRERAVHGTFVSELGFSFGIGDESVQLGFMGAMSGQEGD